MSSILFNYSVIKNYLCTYTIGNVFIIAGGIIVNNSLAAELVFQFGKYLISGLHLKIA